MRARSTTCLTLPPPPALQIIYASARKRSEPARSARTTLFNWPRSTAHAFSMPQPRNAMAIPTFILNRKPIGGGSIPSVRDRSMTRQSDSRTPRHGLSAIPRCRYKDGADLQYLWTEAAAHRRPGHLQLHDAGASRRGAHRVWRRQPNAQLLLCFRSGRRCSSACLLWGASSRQYR